MPPTVTSATLNYHENMGRIGLKEILNQLFHRNVEGPVIEKYKLPPMEIFDKNCPLKRVNQKFAIFRQNVRKLELFW